jgi:TatD DNase family protein
VIDFHCHLDLYDKPQEVAARANAAGVHVLSVTTTPKAWPVTNRLAAGFPRIKTALGLHPQVAHERSTELSLFELLLPETSYIGEVGLDGSADYRAHYKIQHHVFQTILSFSAKAGGRIMSLHSRAATSAVLDSLESHPDAGIPVLHWFAGSSDELGRASDIGCWFSVGTAMMKSKRGRERIALMPKNRILTETDGPFVESGSKPLEPIDADDAVTALADIWGQRREECRTILHDNFQTLVETFSHPR